MSAAVCSGSGVVVDDPIEDDETGTVFYPCPVCWWWHVVEPVEPAGLEPRWRIVDHREAS